MSNDNQEMNEALAKAQAAAAAQAKPGVSITPSPFAKTEDNDDLHFSGGGVPGATARANALEQKRLAEQVEQQKKANAEGAANAQIFDRNYKQKLWAYINGYDDSGSKLKQINFGKWDPGFTDRLNKQYPMTFSTFDRHHPYFKNWYSQAVGHPDWFKRSIEIRESVGLSIGGKFGSILSSLSPWLTGSIRTEIQFTNNGDIVITAANDKSRPLFREKGINVAVACGYVVAQKELDMLVAMEMVKKQEEIEQKLQAEQVSQGLPPLSSEELKKKMAAIFTEEFVEKERANIIGQIPEEVKKKIFTFKIDPINNAKELGELLTEMQNKDPKMHAILSKKTYETIKKEQDKEEYHKLPDEQRTLIEMHMKKYEDKHKPKPEKEKVESKDQSQKEKEKVEPPPASLTTKSRRP